MNEMIRNNLTVATMQVNVQFLQQLQPEWSRFVTIVKQQHKLDEVSYHKLFDILKQYQKEVNELRAERMAKNANPLALVATAQTMQDPYYQTPKHHKSYAPTSKASLPTRSHAATRYKGKEIAKPITPPSESASEEDSDPEQAQKDKDMQKNLALIAKYFKKLYKPTNNNLRTSSNTRNKNVDTNPRYKTDNQTGQFGNQRAINVVGARETVGGPVVQQSGIQCFNCKEFGHYAKECRKPKRVRDSTYHKEKMLLCKQAEKGVQLQAEQSDWLADTDEEIDEQELEAHYSYMAKIQEVPNADSGTDAEPLEQVHYDTDHNVFANDLQHFEQSESISNTCAVETGDSNVIPDSPDMCDNDIQNDQHDVECDDERVALANLIANLKLDVDDNKKIQKQLKKANATLTQELTECKSILAETSRTLGESNSIRDSCLVALQNKQTEFERYKAFNDRTVDYDKLERKLNETLGLLAQKDIDIQEGLKVKAYEISVVQAKHDELVKQSLLTRSHYEGLVKEKTKVITDLKLREDKDIDKMISMEHQLKFLNEIVYKRSQSIQTIHMLAPKCPTFNGRPTFANPRYLKKAQNEIPCLYAIPHDQSDPANRLVPDREETLTLDNESRSKLNKDLVKPFDYTKLNSLYEIFKPPTQHYEIQFAQANEIRKKMWRKSFVKTKPNIFKNIDFLPVSKSISKSRQAYNVMTNNINHLKEIVDQAWVKHSNDLLHLRNPTAQDMEILVKTCLMPLALKTQNDSFAFKEMHADLKNVESLKDEIDELESDKAEFSNMYDMLFLNSRTLNVNVVCATCGKCVFNSNHDACVSMFLNDVHARTKKPNVVPISTRNPKSQANKSVATPHKKTVASESTTINSKSYYRILYKLNLSLLTSGCTKHMTGNLSLLCNFVEKYLGTVRFGNDQFAPILGYGDLVQGNITIKRVYYVEGNDLLTGNRGTDLYTISLQETTSSTPICLMAKASPTQAWLWHRRLSHLNFDYINLLSKKDVVIGLPKLTGVCLRINYVPLVKYTWTLFLRSKDETPEVLKDFLTMIQRNLQAPVISVRTDRGTEFLNKTLNAFFKEEGIEHQTSTPRTPEQNGVVERQNRTLVGACSKGCSSASKTSFIPFGLKSNCNRML
ncbi:retrovirus-related pol polyprotein from transposon TNT 1-94 [Tanacetum coccineum]|uniref:Retrovirus-related pol polyprotein from transposon TNT 1-94 n=1 Tax=Tanacetum coccineum TaxID=301880 RepID=A0ABQ5BXZ8_9ASTR